MMTLSGKYFYGNEISKEGQERGYLDYGTLAKAFGHVLNNNIMEATGWEYWEQVSGFTDHTEEIEELEERIEELEEDENETETDHTAEIEELEAEIRELERDSEEQPEIFQWYIVDTNGATILEEAGEITYYNENLDMYLWGVTHWGTSWDYVLTDVPCMTASWNK